MGGGLAVLRACSTLGSLQGKDAVEQSLKGEWGMEADGVEERTSQDVVRSS